MVQNFFFFFFKVLQQCLDGTTTMKLHYQLLKGHVCLSDMRLGNWKYRQLNECIEGYIDNHWQSQEQKLGHHSNLVPSLLHFLTAPWPFYIIIPALCDWLRLQENSETKQLQKCVCVCIMTHIMSQKSSTAYFSYLKLI